MAYVSPFKSIQPRKRLKLAWKAGGYFILGQNEKIGPFDSVNAALTFHRSNRKRSSGQGLGAAFLSPWM